MFFSFSSCFVRIDPSSDVSLLIKFFLFRCRAWKWKGAVLASPSLSQVIRERLRVMVRCKEESAREWTLSLFRNQTSKADRFLWSWAISNWCKISLASPNWVLMCPICFWLQLWRPLTVALNFFASVSKGQLERGTLDQAASTASWNPSCLVQNDSKWNLAIVGWTSFKPRRSGQWSDPSVAVLCNKQLGKSCSHSDEQSDFLYLAKVGYSQFIFSKVGYSQFNHHKVTVFYTEKNGKIDSRFRTSKTSGLCLCPF